MHRGKELLGQSLKPVTRLIRESMQVSPPNSPMLLLSSTDRLVKKIRLKTMQSDTKIFREVNALSRLSHRNIVRYYTTWVETSEPFTVASDDFSSEFATEDGRASVPEMSERHLPINGGLVSHLKILMIFLGWGLHSPVFILEGRVRLGHLERIVVKMMGLAVCLDLLLPGQLNLLWHHLHFRGLCISRWYLFFILWAVFLVSDRNWICGTSDLERSLCFFLFQQKFILTGWSWSMKGFLKTKLGVCFYKFKLSMPSAICRPIPFFIETSSWLIFSLVLFRLNPTTDVILISVK